MHEPAKPFPSRSLLFDTGLFFFVVFAWSWSFWFVAAALGASVRTPMGSTLMHAGLLGPMLAGHTDLPRLAAVVLAGLQTYKLASMAASEEMELCQTSQLLRSDLKWIFRARLLLLLLVAIYPLLIIALLAEVMGRYLFFVSVVPRNMAATFFGNAREAA